MPVNARKIGVEQLGFLGHAVFRVASLQRFLAMSLERLIAATVEFRFTVWMLASSEAPSALRSHGVGLSGP